MTTVTSGSSNAFIDSLSGKINASAAASAVAAGATTAKEASERFLTLLVTQLQNQDPMNPVDNAQMTSQIAQINTVTGIQQLNETVKGMAGQFAAQQLMQGSAMVGREVLVADNSLAFDSEAQEGAGAFDLAGPAASVQVQVLDANNKQVGTVDLGALKAGRYNFAWEPEAQASGPFRFKVLAANDETAVEATPLSTDKVTAVSLDNGALALRLSRGGTASYSSVKAIL